MFLGKITSISMRNGPGFFLIHFNFGIFCGIDLKHKARLVYAFPKIGIA